ncbi:MAG: hypothetical protein BZY88_09270 [SAR202 cluster bacterium Io17-Chloro-G9]|nr:MAG: hypothetical protein BZY88_09270 [SAR202 cluster bacterium Io17-Chloro-G9]
MADPEHTALAKAGAHAIARWREQIYWRRRSMDLSGAYLSGSRLAGVDLAHDNLSSADLTSADLRLADLSGVNLQEAHLWRSDLSGTDFRRANLKSSSLVRCKLRGSSLHSADLSGADLSYADLWCANLSEANLQGANLTEANLAWADLSGADLRNCRLTATNLEVANLTGADLRGAFFIRPQLTGVSLEDCLFEMTLLADCDLSAVKGLESTRHSGPSIVSTDSLARSKGLIPEDFLRQAGVAGPFIAAQHDIRRTGQTGPKILLVSSVTDAGLAARIQGDLRESGVLSWTLAADDEEVLRSDQAALDRILYYDLLVLVCSTQALENPHTCRVFNHLEPGAAPAHRPRLVTVATDDLLYTRQDSLCTQLRQTEVVDLRGWSKEESYRKGLAHLVSAIAKADG